MKLHRMKILFLIVSIIFSSLFLSGCWSAHELTDEFIIMAIALDKAGDQVRITLQGVRPELSITTSASSQGSKSGGNPNVQFFLLSAEGNSIQEAFDNIDRLSPRIVYGGHVQAFFIGEALAKEGIMPYLDHFSRHHWSQDSAWMVIAKKGTGQNLLTITNPLVNYQSMSLAQLVRKDEVHLPTLYEFLLKFHSESGVQLLASAQPYVNVAAPEDFQMTQLKVEQCAAFRDDKLVGYLESGNSKTADYIQNGMKQARFVLEQICKGPAVGLTLNGGPAKISFSDKEKPMIKVQLRIDFAIADGCGGELTPQKISSIENQLNQVMAVKIQNLFDNLQTEKLDVFNIAEIVHSRHLSYWREVQDKWPEVFSTLPVQIEVDSHLRNTGVMTKSPGSKG